jgi:hypothetical protein
MKMGYSLLTFLISILCFSVSITLAYEPEGIRLTKTKKGYIVDFSLPQYQMLSTSVEREEYLNLHIPVYGITPEAGLPALPLVSFNLFIAYEEKQPTFDIININSEEITLTNKILPFQMPWTKSKPLSEGSFTINEEYYKSTGKENQPVVTISQPFIIGGVRGVIVNVYPFIYNPLMNKLEIIQSTTFEIILEYPVVPAADKSGAFNNFLENVFVNFDGIEDGSVVKYLIITAPDFEASMNQFVYHKLGNGFSVDMFNTNVTGITNTSIKNFIQTRYDKPETKPEFILLVGDVENIPAWTGSGTGSPSTDLNYVQLEGNDYFADAFIGRFSVSTQDELLNAINKSVYMENYAGVLEKKNIFMASTDNWQISEGTHNYVINNNFNPAEYNSTKLYTKTYNATTQELISALNTDQIFAVYSGHGSEYSWADGPPLNQQQVRGLANSSYPFVFSFACVTGSYNLNECFGETWLRTEHGASTFNGSSVDSYWDEDDVLEKKIFYSMFEDDLVRMTPMFVQGMMYLVNYYGGVNGTMLRYMEMYNLMGDPSMPVAGQIVGSTSLPYPITDLETVNPTSNSITLNWSAPYDSTFGGITKYDIRFSLTMINDDNDFYSAQQKILTAQSDTTGTFKSFTIGDLNFSTNYFFAIKAQDEYGNISEMSNVDSMITLFEPELALDRDSVNLIVPKNSVHTDSIVISNISLEHSTLDYDIELKVVTPADSDWLYLNQYMGTLSSGTSNVIVLNINTENLEVGEYSMDMVFATNDPKNPEVTIPINLTVINDVSLINEDEMNLPTEYVLTQNYPNPFNPTTAIGFQIPVSTYIVIVIYNSIGEKVIEVLTENLKQDITGLNLMQLLFHPAFIFTGLRVSNSFL